MPLKRSYQVGSFQDYQSRKRIKRTVDLALKKNLETKTKVFSYAPSIGPAALGVLDITNIDQDSTDTGRIGSKINVLRVELRGSYSVSGNNGKNVTTYLLTSESNVLPTIADMIAVTPGGYFKNVPFQELCRPFVSSINPVVPVKLSWKPKYPWAVLYTGSGGSTGIRNRLLITVVNPESAGISTISYSVKVWYRDG